MRKSESLNRHGWVPMTRDELLSNPDYLSACVMKCLWRGELGLARYYLERLTVLQVAKGSGEPCP